MKDKKQGSDWFDALDNTIQRLKIKKILGKTSLQQFSRIEKMFLIPVLALLYWLLIIILIGAGAAIEEAIAWR